MSILDIVYASAPTSEVLIPTLEIVNTSASVAIRICGGFNNVTATLEDSSVVEFIAAGIDVALPAKDSSGQQNLTFAIDNVMGDVQQAADACIEAGTQTEVIYRTYLASDLSAPAEPAARMVLAGGMLKGGSAQIQASYYDLLNTAWPRERYTPAFAPGLKYIS